MVGGWKEDGILRNNVVFGLEAATVFSFLVCFIMFFLVFWGVSSVSQCLHSPFPLSSLS